MLGWHGHIAVRTRMVRLFDCFLNLTSSLVKRTVVFLGPGLNPLGHNTCALAAARVRVSLRGDSRGLCGS
jgi:hypothetical protein